MENELKHFGIMGMKWGIRRYQYPDGTRTPAGKKRYSSGKVDVKSMSDEDLKKAVTRGNLERRYASLSNSKKSGASSQAISNTSTIIRNAGKVAGMYSINDNDDFASAKKFSKNAANALDASASLAKSAKDYQKLKKKDRAQIESMSDQELQILVNRLELERQFKSMYEPEKSGMDYVNDVLGTVGTLSTIVVSGVALYKMGKPLWDKLAWSFVG